MSEYYKALCFKKIISFFSPERNLYFIAVPRKFGFSEKGSTDIKSSKTGALDEFLTSDGAALVRKLKGLSNVHRKKKNVVPLTDHVLSEMIFSRYISVPPNKCSD